MLSKEDEATADFVVTAKLTKAQLGGDEEILIHLGASRKPFVMGESLVWPKLLRMLPTRIRELHQWYMKQPVDEIVMFAARVQDRYLYQGTADV